ncbi:response regulator transcription factor, partial [Streptomyces sp. NPDC090301]|uniref:helix-turn-helix domain-containing protein n=1 Tax=Streptomyces sp. NPDC090301 TaxID=3154975 RepID=UPI0034161A1D
ASEGGGLAGYSLRTPARPPSPRGGLPPGAGAPGLGRAVPPPRLLATARGKAPTPTKRDLPDDLTPREREVLALIGLGLPNRGIAEKLFISEATVKTHINNLFAKAGLRDRPDAVRLAIEADLA